MSNLFASNSESYKKYRPVYPAELFEFLDGAVATNDLAWDCGCGTGQVSVKLSSYYKKVVGTDISASQIKSAEKRDNIVYRVSNEGQSGLDERTVDLVTCAQALHWFDIAKFYSEVKRVLRKDGVISVWTYNLFRVNKQVDQLIDNFYFDSIYNYWPEERKHVENGYSELELPFKQITVPQFNMEAQWTLDQLMGYLNTWTGVKNYIELECFSPIEFIEKELEDIWGDKNKKRKITWPLTVLVGKA